MRFQNPSNGHIETASLPILWTFLFGCFYFAFKGFWMHAAIAFVAALITSGLSWLIYPFFAPMIVRNYYLRNGWLPVDDEPVGVAPAPSSQPQHQPSPAWNRGETQRPKFGQPRNSFTITRVPKRSWSGGDIFFWVAIVFCGLIFLGALGQIADPEGARARKEGSAARSAQKVQTAVETTSGSGESRRAEKSGCDVTMENFRRLQSGMSYSNARRILNCDGEELSRVEMAGIPTSIMYQWNANRGYGNMNAMFQDDRLVSKAQFGLK